ncbi:MoaD/ThiS family protein, partial [Halanaerobium congolense]
MNEINFKSVNNSFTKKLLYSVTILLAVSILVFSNISLQGSVIKVLAQASSNTDIQSINNEIVVRVNNDGESYMNDPTIGTAYTGKSVTLSRGNTVSDLISALDSEPAGNNQQYQVLNNNEVVKNDGASLVTGDKLSVKAENGTEVFYKVWLTLDTSNLSDWNNVNTFVADSTGDFGNKNDITKFYVTNDEQFIYFRWDLDELYNGKSNIGAAFSTSADGSTLDGMVWIEFDNPNVVTVFSIEKINGKRSTSYSQDETNVTIFSGSEDSIVAKVSFSDFSEANLTGINNNSVVPLWAQTNASQSSRAAGKDFAPSEGTFFEYNTSNSDYVLGGDGAPPKITVEDSITNETTPTITGTSDEI